MTPSSVQGHPQTHIWVFNVHLQSAVAGQGKARERSLFSHSQQATSRVTKQPAGRVHRRHQKYAARSQALIEEINPSPREPETSLKGGRMDSFAPWMQTARGGSWYG